MDPDENRSVFIKVDKIGSVHRKLIGLIYLFFEKMKNRK
jgi:hypothetical protein